ncbi:hypothetical protein [Plastoroseomonas arctica]|uniref:Uncharacterized protein n=1 Tax=Plastoroseomonas arctica TaxID=1509237 RepID=A0AAF1KHP2_9PROT|nr:hypothetical protein [Plastoroseomonas arctica]MBR0653655.1 hypothetical protein [Plastoroseomonas arctica]
MADDVNITPSNPIGRRNLAALFGLSLGVPLPAASAELLASTPGAPLTPVALACAALKAVQDRRDWINRVDSTQEEVDAWCQDDWDAAEALAEAQSQTPRDALLKVAFMLRRMKDNDWNFMDCEKDCLEGASLEIERFFPGLPL